ARGCVRPAGYQVRAGACSLAELPTAVGACAPNAWNPRPVAGESELCERAGTDDGGHEGAEGAVGQYATERNGERDVAVVQERWDGRFGHADPGGQEGHEGGQHADGIGDEEEGHRRPDAGGA